MTTPEFIIAFEICRFEEQLLLLCVDFGNSDDVGLSASIFSCPCILVRASILRFQLRTRLSTLSVGVFRAPWAFMSSTHGIPHPANIKLFPPCKAGKLCDQALPNMRCHICHFSDGINFKIWNADQCRSYQRIDRIHSIAETLMALCEVIQFPWATLSKAILTLISQELFVHRTKKIITAALCRFSHPISSLTFIINVVTDDVPHWSSTSVRHVSLKPNFNGENKRMTWK